MNEQQMRDAQVPTLDSADELKQYIQELVERDHDYGTCVYAMSMAGTAAFNHVASRLGVSGFQTSCADLDILRRTRYMKGPFIIIKIEDFLYPQYDPVGKLVEFANSPSSQKWLKEEAQKRLDEYEAEDGKYGAHPNVIARWRFLAGQEINDDSD